MLSNMRLHGLFLLLTYLTCIYPNEIQDLSNEKWILRNEDLNISVPAQIPGNVHMDLMAQNIIGDPYFQFGYEKYAWISDQSWTYEAKVFVSKELSKYNSVRLKFDGIDTVADIFLNGKLLGQSDNLFTTYSFEVINILQKENTIMLKFVSPTSYAEMKYKEYLDAFGYEVPPVELPEVQHGRNHQNFIRKEQCSFSWDWGPSFPTIGIWKNARLEFVKLAVIEHILIHTLYSKETKEWLVTMEAVIESSIKRDILVKYGFNNIHRETKISLQADYQKIKLGVINVPSNEVEMWWPRGYGDQVLYDAHVRLIDSDTLQSTSKSVKFGFREIELVQEPIKESQGLSFYFKVNSQPIFMKGSNWIPADSFQNRVTEETLETLLNDTVEANMNALRVWGGGIYEQDLFYDIADRLGILIWQDLMFAVALYPVDETFLENVQKEALHQVLRLQHHPSIVIWSGNNENEAAIVQKWWPEVEKHKEKYIADYKKLYFETLRPIVESLDWSRPFILSSPSNGKLSDKEIISDNPGSEFYGDVHYYNYDGNCWDTNIFPVPRFASEYGYQSYPSYETLLQASDASQLTWNSSLMFNRQHHANGNQEIENFIKMNFDLPLASKHPNNYFQDMIFLSQLVQALCIKYESEHYRRWHGRINSEGKGYTMGALYWQLNDIWQGPSWSSIEYGGRWKILHYYVKQFFNSAVVSGYLEDKKVNVFALLDHPSISPPMSVLVTVHQWDSFNPVYASAVDVTESKESTLVAQYDVYTLCPEENCFMELKLYERTSGILRSTTHVFLQPFNKVSLRDPQLQISSISHVSKDTFSITVNAVLPAAFVWFETNIPGHYSDNGFIMTTNTIEVKFYTSDELTDAVLLLQVMTIKSLYNVYH